MTDLEKISTPPRKKKEKKLTAKTKIKSRTNNGYAMYWTISAVQCYMLGCQCLKCNIPDLLESKCLMKKAVMELVRKFGKPTQEMIKNIKKEINKQND